MVLCPSMLGDSGAIKAADVKGRCCNRIKGGVDRRNSDLTRNREIIFRLEDTTDGQGAFDERARDSISTHRYDPSAARFRAEPTWTVNRENLGAEMRTIFVLACCLVISGCAFSQDSRADVFAGYSYVNIDTNGLSSRQNANGWEASVAGYFNKWFGVEGEGSGYYKNFTGLSVKVTDYAFAAGPRVNLKPLFVHALFGGDHLSCNGCGSQDSVAGLAGGGVQWRIAGLWSVRASFDYVFTRHNILGGPSVTQNNFRAGAGIVYSFGARHRMAKAAPTVEPRPAPAPPAEPAPMPMPSPHRVAVSPKLDALGIVVASGRNAGAEIVDESPDGLAALAGLRPGDVINAIDGKAVRTPQELAAEFSSRQAGDRVRIGYLIKGAWQSEVVVELTR